MAEAVRANVPGVIIRVRLHVADPARRHALATVLRESGCLISDLSDAHVTIADGEANSLNVSAEDGSHAHGVLPADSSPRQIEAALRAVAAGLNVQTPVGSRFAALDEHEAPSPLTPRELEILIALSDGLTTSTSPAASRFRSTR
jgi:hypothetical protein